MMKRDKYLISFVIMAVISVGIASGYIYYMFAADICGKNNSLRNNIDADSVKKAEPDSLSNQLNFVAQSYYETLTSKPVKNAYSKTVRDSIIHILAGEWLRLDYYTVLKKTKSPMKAIEKPEVYDNIYLKIIEDSKDINAFGVYILNGFHDSDVCKFSLEKSDSLVFISDYFQLQLLSGKSNHIILHSTYRSGFHVEYIKCSPLEETVNQLLVAGEYINTADDNNKTITFKPNGSITGMGTMKHYLIVLDPFMKDCDNILMYDEKNQSEFVFEIKGKYLKLYEADYKDSDGNYVYDKGKLKYDLLKKE